MTIANFTYCLWKYDNLLLAFLMFACQNYYMPVLSMFYGIIIRMYREAGGKHNMPHIHAEYSGQEIVVALDGTVLEGAIPKNKMKLLDAWLEIHREALEANCKLLSNGERYFRIDPLR